MNLPSIHCCTAAFFNILKSRWMKSKYAGLIFFVLSLNSCTVMYRPTLQNVPMFYKKRDLQVSVANHNAAVAYSVTPAIGVIASGYYRNKLQNLPSSDKSSHYDGYQRNLSFAVGYYKVRPRGSFEIFGGYGKGYSSLFFYSQGKGGAQSNFNMFFVQPALIVGDREKYSAYGFSCRLLFVNFYDFKEVNRAVTPQIQGFVEPGFTIRLKSGAIAFKAQAFASVPLSEPKQKTADYFPYANFLAINGVIELHVSDLFAKKKENNND
jgi:hypothetical protein